MYNPTQRFKDKKIAWKSVQVNLWSTFGSQHDNNWHFKDFKVITISSNAISTAELSNSVQDIKPERFIGYNTCDALVLGYVYINNDELC